MTPSRPPVGIVPVPELEEARMPATVKAHQALQKADKLLIEVMYKADYCLLCYYMDEAVREVLPRYEEKIVYKRVHFMTQEGGKRFLELSKSLYGEEGVVKHRRLAPVPSLFIEGELVFDMIPTRDELEEAIEEALERHESRFPDRSEE